MIEEARKERETDRRKGVCKVSERRDRAGKIGSERRG